MGQRSVRKTCLKLLHGCITQFPTARCRIFSLIKAFLFPKSFIASLLSDTWKNEMIWSLRKLDADMPDMLGDCTTAGWANFSPRSAIEHNDKRWFVAPCSMPSVAGAVVCGGDTATPLSASGRSGDVRDSFRTPRSSTPATDDGDISADMTRGTVRVRTGWDVVVHWSSTLRQQLQSAAPAPLIIQPASGVRQPRVDLQAPATAKASPLIEYAGCRSMPHWRLDRYYLGSHHRQFPALLRW